MYTRCPSCRAEISFEPPANMERLPDGYKHRIKCPSCGVTIGVKISRVDTVPQQQEYVQQPFEPVYASEEGISKKAKARAKARAKAAAPKRSGVGRNIVIMILSLLFIGISVCGYYIDAINGLIGDTSSILYDLFGIKSLDGIMYWDTLIYRTNNFVNYFSDSILDGIIEIIPMIVFTLACLNFLVAFISACGKKYGRAYNFISSLLIGAAAIALLIVTAQSWAADNIIEGFKIMFSEERIMYNIALLVYAVLGLLQFIFGLCFVKSLKKKQF